jgi:hypothetical protein
MKVYVAERAWDYEGFEIIGIFSFRTAAEKAIEADKSRGKSKADSYEIEELEIDPEGMWR